MDVLNDQIDQEILQRLQRIFRPAWYLTAYPDIEQAAIDPWEHFANTGLYEGRTPTPLFDPVWYRERYRYEVPAQVPAIIHYLRTGGAKDLSPSALFDAAWYRRHVENSTSAPTLLEEYQRRTILDAASPHPFFWTAWYVERAAMDASEALAPLEHYLTYGWRQGLSPSPFFSPGHYAKFVSGVEAAGVEPLGHYAQSGHYPSMFFTQCWASASVASALDQSCDAPAVDRFILSELKGESLVEGLATVLLQANDRADAFFSSLQRMSASSTLSSTQLVKTAWRTRAASLEIPSASNPRVSIVIPTINHAYEVVRCLESIVSSGCATTYEIVVVDDCSSDEHYEVLAQIKGIQLIRNATNEGFAEASRKGVTASRGSMALFLNDDTEVLPLWLDAMVAALDADPTVGLVGSMILHYDFLLQEAGGIVFSDASACHYGEGSNPLDRRFSRSRDADYCSGCSLLVTRAAWDAVGGFDKLLNPAYYEDTDLAFSLRQRGFRTVYEPTSIVLHQEGRSYGKGRSSANEMLMAKNRELFHQKWRDVLATHHPRSDEVDEIVWPLPAIAPDARCVLVVDHIVPIPQHDAGSLRLVGVMQELIRQGRQVYFLPMGRHGFEPATSELEALGVHVFHSPLESDRFGRLLARHIDNVEFVWVSRPETAADFASQFLSWFPGVPYVYDSVDAHTHRLRRRLAVDGLATTAELMHKMEKLERVFLRMADVVVTLSDTDHDALVLTAGSDFREVRIPTVHVDAPSGENFQERRGLLFVGNYQHDPNVDAAQYLTSTVLPLIREKLGPVPLTLAGSSPTPVVLALEDSQISVPGWQRSLENLYHHARVVVAPLRYGAGVKGKIGEALSYGVPVVTTSIGVEGMKLRAGIDIEVADDPQGFADRVVDLYNDQDHWEAVSESGRVAIREQFGVEAMGSRIKELLRVVAEVRSSES